MALPPGYFGGFHVGISVGNTWVFCGYFPTILAHVFLAP